MLALFRLSVACYFAAAGLGLAYLYSRDETLAAWKYRVLATGLAAHLASTLWMLVLFWAYPENRFFFPANSFFGALSWLALTNALVFFVVEAFARVHILGAFVLPWSCLAGGLALFAAPEIGPLAPQLRSFRLNLHPMLLMFAYTACANAFGVGLALLIQENQVKSRKPSELCYRLPSIEQLDRIHFRILTYVFLIMTVGLFMGSVWASKEWTGWGSDAKVLSTFLTWAIYLACVVLRAKGRIRGRKLVYLAQAGFASVLLTFFVINYLSAKHGFLYGR